MAVAMNAAEAELEIINSGLENDVRVGCINSPQNITISGLETAIDVLGDFLTSKKIFARKLKTGGKAYHSYDMQNYGADYEQLVEIAFQAYRGGDDTSVDMRMFSSVTTQEIFKSELRSASYWRQNLESPVRFYEAICQCLGTDSYTFVEFGPHPAMKLPLREIFNHCGDISTLRYQPTFIRNKSCIDTTLSAVGQLFLHGTDVAFSKINALACPSDATSDAWKNFKVLSDIPTYTWQHDEALWVEPRVSSEYRNRKHSYHNLLGSLISTGDDRLSIWRNVFRIKDVPWLRDHRLNEPIAFPAAAYVVVAMQAITQSPDAHICEGSSIKIRDFKVLNAFTMSDADTESFEVYTELHSTDALQAKSAIRSRRFEISSRSGQSMVPHASGWIIVEARSKQQSRAPSISDAHVATTLEAVSSNHWFQQLREDGLNLGPRFCKLQNLQIDRRRVSPFAKGTLCDLNDSDPHMNTMIHPTSLDALLQVGLVANYSGSLSRLKVGLSVSVEEIDFRVQAMGNHRGDFEVSAVAKEAGYGGMVFDADLVDEHCEPILSIHHCQCVYYQPIRPMSKDDVPPVWSLRWKPDIYHNSSRVLSEYLVQSVGQCPARLPISRLDSLSREEKATVFCLDLILHKKPQRQIAIVGGAQSEQYCDAIIKVCNLDTSMPRCQKCSFVGPDWKVNSVSNRPTTHTVESGVSVDQVSYEALDVLIHIEVRLQRHSFARFK